MSFGPHGGVPVNKYAHATPTTTKTKRIINVLRMWMRFNNVMGGLFYSLSFSCFCF